MTVSNTTLAHGMPGVYGLLLLEVVARFGISEQSFGERKRLAMRVRDLLMQSTERYPSIEAIADQLHMSDRTLKRQLAAEGTSYSNVVEDLRHRHAVSLLSRSDFSIEKIADELGYSDVGNFARAFKRWTGKTPGNWRKDPYL